MHVPDHLIPTRSDLVGKRWLGPLRPHLANDRLWEMNRQSVARAVAIGLFVGFLVPVAQFVAAVVLAVVFRGHIAISAACTMISNPLTFTPIYWLAYKLGASLLPTPTAPPVLQTRLHSWLDAGWLWEGVKANGLPVLVGLLLMALTGAVLGYTAVWLLWRSRSPEVATPSPAD